LLRPLAGPSHGPSAVTAGTSSTLKGPTLSMCLLGDYPLNCYTRWRPHQRAHTSLPYAIGPHILYMVVGGSPLICYTPLRGPSQGPRASTVGTFGTPQRPKFSMWLLWGPPRFATPLGGAITGRSGTHPQMWPWSDINPLMWPWSDIVALVGNKSSNVALHGHGGILKCGLGQA
jgi:hypothetical protein